MELEDDWATFQPDVLKRSLRHPDRTPYICPLRYEVTPPYDAFGCRRQWQTAFSVNFSAEGVCMFTDGAQLLVPQTIVCLSGASADTGARAVGEIRWVRTLPRRFDNPCLVGIKLVT